MGKTLWQRWTEKPEQPAEETIYNPLELRIGSSLTINALDWHDCHFFVKEIREYKRANAESFSDYVLLASPLGKPDVAARLRCFQGTDELPYQPVLLSLYDEFSWNDDFSKILNADTK